MKRRQRLLRISASNSVGRVSEALVSGPGTLQMPAETAAALQRMNDLSQEASEALSFPLSMGELRQDADRAGDPCSVVDCVINAEVVRVLLSRLSRLSGLRV